MEALSNLNIARISEWILENECYNKINYVAVVFTREKASPFNIKRSVNTIHVHALQERYSPTEDKNIDFST